ncbi:hypothetical protein FACS1894130_08660 [Spirochaetia bacterium]|nr:hypothetical protein FACS1894130_08660 [Spirochaetia bacterium]
MGKKRRIIKIAAPLLIVVLLLAAALVFISRSPVLVVSDSAFDGMYGGLRLRVKRVETSVRLWRQVKTVRIAEDAGEDVAIFAIGAAATKPFCVLFPYRYYNEAKRYAGEFPAVPVGVLQGRLRDLSGPPPNLFFFGTDSTLDFYRAGQCAAIFAQSMIGAGESLAESPDAAGVSAQTASEPGEILFFQDDLVSEEDREAFSLGLAEKGYGRTPVYQNAGASFTPRPDTACVVIRGAAQSFFEQSLDIPVLLFSWIDPALTPDRIKLVFDDSPWALAVPVVKMIEGDINNIEDIGDIKIIPSEIQILSRRISEKERRENIKRAVLSRMP